MLKIEHLKKHYDNFSLDCSLELMSGCVTGLIGQNGAGKSTTFKAILGLISTDGGNITILGKDRKDFTAKDKEELGVVLSDSGFSGYLKIKDIIPILQNMYSKFDKSLFIEQVQKFQLPMNKQIKEFSTGMKAKLKVLVAISHNAKLLILDEPTAGLDVIARDELLEMLREFLEKDEERSILISSHISSDLESLCDDLYMIHDGKIILHEDTDVLLSDYALLKVDAEQYSKLDKQFILRSKKETYGYSCLTNQKQYYMENYPKIAIEKGTIDEVITMMIRGDRTMKGLFVKDLKLMMLQKNFLLLILAIVIGMMIFTDDVIFPLGFLSFIVSLFTVSTISYDDFDNGNAFLFTLPITRNHYVSEKYFLGLLLGCMAWVLATVLGIITTVLKDTLPITDLVQSSLMILPIMIVVQAIMLPFQLKFGGDKGRIAMIGAFGGLAVITLVIVKGAEAIFNIDLVSLLDNMPTVSMGVLIAIAIIIALLMLLVSMKISLSIMNKKEF